MKVKTSEATGVVLDWLVAKCESYSKSIRLNRFKELEDLGRTRVQDDNYTLYSPSTDWSQGGWIIEENNIGIWPSEKDGREGQWGARKYQELIVYGPTPLIAAMRCFVASKLGDEVDVPKELA